MDYYQYKHSYAGFPVKNVGVVFDYGMSQINLNLNLNLIETVDVNLKYKIQGPSTCVKVRY